MPQSVLGLHHVTTKASDPRRADRFWRQVMGLSRVKQSVNFDNPSVYHLYFGDAAGTPGSLITYFPSPGLAAGRRGSGEVGSVAFAMGQGELDDWQARLSAAGIKGLRQTQRFGERRLEFRAPDGDGFALLAGAPNRQPALHGVELVLKEVRATGEILRFMGYRESGSEGAVTRFSLPGATRAAHVDLRAAPEMPAAEEGAGSVHHVAFAVASDPALREMRKALLARGLGVSEIYDRDYFRSIYFRTPGGVLFEIATNPPGFAIDEPKDALGRRLCLPAQHANLRAQLEASLVPLD